MIEIDLEQWGQKSDDARLLRNCILAGSKHFVFSGLMFAGKDYVAEQAGMRTIGFADPIYAIARYFLGTSDKSKPGVREFLQQIGQWGWGCVSDKYPMHNLRKLIVDEIKSWSAASASSRQVPLPGDVCWADFGDKTSFWVDILLNRLQGIKHGCGDSWGEIGCPWYEFLVHENIAKDSEAGRTMLAALFPRFAVVNARFLHELEPLQANGFTHCHVMCSEKERGRRMVNKGYMPTAEALNDASEQMAMKLDHEMPREYCIWNDDPALCPDARMMLVEEFRNMLVPAGQKDAPASST